MSRETRIMSLEYGYIFSRVIFLESVSSMAYDLSLPFRARGRTEIKGAEKRYGRVRMNVPARGFSREDAEEAPTPKG